MKVVDLKKFDFYNGNVAKISDEEFVFGHMRIVNRYVRIFFYVYNLLDDSIRQITKDGIEMYDFDTHLSTIVEDGYIYTNISGLEGFYDFYKISIKDGSYELMYSFDSDGGAYILNKRYALFYGYGYEGEDLDEAKKYEEDEALYLIDFEEKKHYVVDDDAIHFEDGGKLETYVYDNEQWLVYEVGQTSSDYVSRVYGKDVSLKMIKVNALVNSVKDKEKLNPKTIWESKDNIGVRLNFIDRENIYFQVTDLKSMKQEIYEMSKKDYEIKKVKHYDISLDENGRISKYYDVKSNQIITQKLDENKDLYIEKNDITINFKYNDERFLALLEEFLITESFENEKLRVINLKDLTEKEHENTYKILENNLILFEIF